MTRAGELPEELLRRPTGLVVLTGLDVTYNAIHKAIWDSFCNNRRPDRVPLQFKVLEGDHEYPKCRSKQRTSYEWYMPKGVLKTAWMKKHLENVPAVVVLFFDLDWDESMWKEKQMECASKIETVRNSLSGRSTRVAMVLIQRNAPLPPGEDVIAAERAASLCSACDLSAKSLFVLPHTDHLLGYTIRLENAFYELAQGYYHTEARRVKAHKEFLNKTTHQLLYVRHQFKIAFFNELKQDSHTGIKHYKQAYGHILDLRMHDTNMLEIKTIAGFINYKICRLSFQHNAPLDAIAQFRKHIDFFKNRVGIPELAFEHSAWMSKQFQVFGDLFDEAIKLGLTAIQTQHPGFYYQQAANHAMIRKQLCVGLCHAVTTPPTPDPLENLNNLDYYGQRPWRQGHQSIDPPDALKERDGIQALQGLEVSVDHSWIIIPLLSSAVAQFKKYKSPRMKRYLMVQMGEEYYHAKDYNKALVLLSRVTWDYRNERWWPLLTSILHTSLRCAYLVGNAQEYVRICLQLISKYAQCTSEQKTRIQMNLIRVMSNDPPEPEPGCATACIENAKQLWKHGPSTHEPRIFKVEMQNIVPFVECKARFSQDVFTADKPVALHVYLRTHCPFPMRFSKLYVLLSNQAYSSHCVVTDGGAISSTSTTSSEPGSADLYLVPGTTKVHSFSFLPLAPDVGKNVEINYVALELGLESARCAILHWTGGGGDAVSPPMCQQMNRPRPSGKQDSSEWQFIEVNPTAKIEPRDPNIEIDVEHQSPSLVNEFYLVNIHITNKETVPISNVSLSFGLKEGQEATLDQTTHVSVDKAEYEGKVVSRKMGITIGDMKPGAKCTKQIYLKCLHTGVRTMFAKVAYEVVVTTVSQEIQCECNKQEVFSLATVLPFDIAIKLTSMKMEVIDAVHVDEPFLLVSDIKSTSPWQLDIQNSQLTLSHYVKSNDGKLESYLDGVTLNNQDSASECNCLVVPPSVQSSVPLGSYTISWRRKHEDSSLPYVSTILQLPSLSIEQVPLYVTLDLPSQGYVRTCMTVTYSLYNRTMYAQEVDIIMESSDAFMFSGHKQLHMRLLPNIKTQLTYNLFPLLAGNLALPTLRMNLVRYPGVAESLLQSMLPTHIFVKPSGREHVKA